MARVSPVLACTGPSGLGQGQGQKNWARAGPDRPVDTLAATVAHNLSLPFHRDVDTWQASSTLNFEVFLQSIIVFSGLSSF